MPNPHPQCFPEVGERTRLVRPVDPSWTCEVDQNFKRLAGSSAILAIYAIPGVAYVSPEAIADLPQAEMAASPQDLRNSLRQEITDIASDAETGLGSIVTPLTAKIDHVRTDKQRAKHGIRHARVLFRLEDVESDDYPDSFVIAGEREGVLPLLGIPLKPRSADAASRPNVRFASVRIYDPETTFEDVRQLLLNSLPGQQRRVPLQALQPVATK